MRMLIVNDNAQDRHNITQLLQTAFPDLVLLGADTPEAYAEALALGDVDLVLTEDTPSWTDGLSVLRDIQGRWPDVPVIMVAAAGNERLAIEGFRAGLLDYVTRDKLEELVQAVRRCLSSGTTIRPGDESSPEKAPKKATENRAFRDTILPGMTDRGPVDFLSGGGEGSVRIRVHDWASTPLGPIESWPQSLRTNVATVLTTRFPAILMWGDALTVCAYNDAYRPFLGAKSEALGRAFLEVWSEARDIIEPQLARARRGETNFSKDAAFTLTRHGYPEQAYFDYAFSPVGQETGAVCGILNIAVETTERVQLEAALGKSRQQLAVELDAARRLHMVSTQLIQVDEIEVLYEQILDAAVAVLQSDYASLQLFHPNRGTQGALQLLGHRGFNPAAVAFWEWVYPESESACGMALRTGRKVVIPDIEQSEFMVGSEDLATSRQTGIRAVQTTPLISRTGKVLGAISTHWRHAHKPSDGELCTLDVLARFAADLIDRKQAEARLAQYTAELETLNETNRILLQEVNHRVKNTLTAILGLISAEQCRMEKEDVVRPDLMRARTALGSLYERVRSLATVHGLLSSGQWRPLRVDELVTEIIRESVPYRIEDSQCLLLEVNGEKAFVSPKQAHHLALIIGELTTNTVKHGWREGKLRISVDVELVNGDVRVVYRNSGPAYPDQILNGEGYSVGLSIVDGIATHSLRGTWAVWNDDGPVTEIRFPADQELSEKAPMNDDGTHD